MNNNRLTQILLFLALLLTKKGFADVHIVHGGMTKWLDAGLPIVR